MPTSTPRPGDSDVPIFPGCVRDIRSLVDEGEAPPTLPALPSAGGNRGAPRLCRGAAERWGESSCRASGEIEERHGCAGALPSVGGLGGPFEAPHLINPNPRGRGER